MLQVQPNSTTPNSNYTVSSTSSTYPQSTLSPNRNSLSGNRRTGFKYRPPSTNSLASNFSSFSASSTYVHPSSVYEGQEGRDDPDSRHYYGLNVDRYDDPDLSGPDAYDEEDYNNSYPPEDYDDDSGDTPFSYHDTSTVEKALPFHVLAVYDFTEGDPENMLLFQKGDLLEIISVQSSGWWAAQALDDEPQNESTEDTQKQPGQSQERVGWIPSAFVNVIPPHLVQRLKETPREHRISNYERAELFVESPEDIENLIQSWGLQFDILDRDREQNAVYEEAGEVVKDEVTDEINAAVDKILQHELLVSLQAPAHPPAGPRRRPLPVIQSPTAGKSSTPPPLTTAFTILTSDAVKPQTTTTTVPAAVTSPVQPSPITPIPPNVPAPAPFNLGRRGSVGTITGVRHRERDRDLPPSLPPPDTPLPPLPEVTEPDIEIPVPDFSDQHRSPLPSNAHHHQRSASASTVGTFSSTAVAAGTLVANHKHDVRTPSPLPTPPVTAKSSGVGAHLISTTPSGNIQGISSFSSTTNITSPASAPSTTLRFPIKDKPIPPTPRVATELLHAQDLQRERSGSITDSTRSASPPNSAFSASGDDGHPAVLVPGADPTAHYSGHVHTVSLPSTTHTRSSSSISSLSFLPRSRSVNHGLGSGSGGPHNVISGAISNSLSSLRRKAARYGPGGGGGSSGSLSGASIVAANETINITSSPKHIHQKLFGDETASVGSTPGADVDDDDDDDDSVIAATKKHRGRASPPPAIAPIQSGDKEKVRKVLGDDALYFLNAGTNGGAGAVNGVHAVKPSNGPSPSGPINSTGKANAGVFARRRRENKRQSHESDSSSGVNGRPGSGSSFPSVSVGSSISTPLTSSPNPTSGGLASHLDLNSPDDIDADLEEDLDVGSDGDQTQAGRSFPPLPDESRTASLSSRIRSPRTPRTPRTPHGASATSRTASGFPAAITGPSVVKGDKVRRLLGDDDAQAFHNAKQAFAKLPWYLKPERDVDSGEIKLEHDGSVKYGSVEALVERLTVPFLMAERVLELLVEKYEMPEPAGLSDDEFDDWKDKKLRPTRARVLHVLSLWVDNYGLIQDDPRAIPRLQSFLELVHEPPQNMQNARLILQKIANKRWTDINLPALESVAATRRPAKFSKTKTDVLQIDHGELARHLTLYEARLYLKIRPHECFKFAANQKAEGISNLRAFIATSDKIASWVKMSVLKNDPLGKRADVIQFWIRVAERCRGLNNFSSTAAIVAALTSQVIARLQLTWAHVSRTSRIDPLLKIFETTNNFASYRNMLTTVDGGCVPYIGIFLSDMVKISEGFPDPPKLTVPSSTASTSSASTSASQESREIKLINFSKYNKMEDVAQMILKFQPKVRDTYKFVEVVPTMQFVESQLSLAAARDENEFWTRSQALQRSELAHVDIRKGLELAGF